MNNSFLSIVEPKKGEGKPGCLLVRARVKGDIEAKFPSAKVVERLDRDYRFRALIDRKLVASTIAEEVMSTDYNNFKSSVAENDRHDAYFRVWAAMHDLQMKRLAPPVPKGSQPLPFWDDDQYQGFARR